MRDLSQIRIIQCFISYQEDENSLGPNFHTSYQKIHKSKKFLQNNRSKEHETYSSWQFIHQPKEV